MDLRGLMHGRAGTVGHRAMPGRQPTCHRYSQDVVLVRNRIVTAIPEQEAHEIDFGGRRPNITLQGNIKEQRSPAKQAANRCDR